MAFHLKLLLVSVLTLCFHFSGRQSTIDSLQYQLTQGNVAEVAEQIALGRNPFMPGNREPTLAECEAIIKHLQRANEQQSHEVCMLSVVCQYGMLSAACQYGSGMGKSHQHHSLVKASN